MLTAYCKECQEFSMHHSFVVILYNAISGSDRMDRKLLLQHIQSDIETIHFYHIPLTKMTCGVISHP